MSRSLIKLIEFSPKFAMLPKAEMVPKDCGFSQSKKACGFCTGIAWHFPCSPTTARDGEIIQMQQSCHHVDAFRCPNSSYVTTKLYGTSTYGCNNNTIFWERTIFMFPTVVLCRAHWPGSDKALMIHAKVERWQHRSVHHVWGERSLSLATAHANPHSSERIYRSRRSVK